MKTPGENSPAGDSFLEGSDPSAITRRKFLEGLGLAFGAAVLSACGPSVNPLEKGKTGNRGVSEGSGSGPEGCAPEGCSPEGC